MDKYYRIKAKEGVTLPSNVILPPYKSDDKGTVISIDGSGFAGHTEIESFIISENVKYIGAKAFDGCTGIEEITIPASVTSMGESVFNGCSSLTINLSYTEAEIGGLENWSANWLNGATNVEPIYVPTYSITAPSLVNGSIEADKAAAKVGDTIQLTVTPAEGYKVNWVKYNGKTLTYPYSFIMPAMNVVITAEFIVEGGSDEPEEFIVPFKYVTNANGSYEWIEVNNVQTNDTYTDSAYIVSDNFTGYQHIAELSNMWNIVVLPHSYDLSKNIYTYDSTKESWVEASMPNINKYESLESVLDAGTGIAEVFWSDIDFNTYYIWIDKTMYSGSLKYRYSEEV